MKQLRCTSCGAELKVKEDKEYAVCEHCGSSYKLNEDLNINFKMDDNMKDVFKEGLEHSKKVSKFMIIPFVIVFVLVICVIVFSFLGAFNSRNESSKRQNEANENYEKAKQEREKYTFNFQFTSAAGTEYGSQVEHTLDAIIESNKSYDRKVTLVFNGESTIDENRIIEIKQSLGKWDKYEVIVNRDSDGYINEIKVDKVA